SRQRTKPVPLETDVFDDVPPVGRKRAAAPVAAGSDPEARRATEPVAKSAPARRTDGFDLPPLSMLALTPSSAGKHQATEKELRETADVIEATLATFDIQARVVEWIPGPTVTMFEIQIAKGVKVHRITALSDDMALALAAPTIRILAPIPGKSLIGFEVPNDRRATVTLGDTFAAARLTDEGPLALLIGKDVSGESVVADLAKMPHLLIAGATGTGKSVCINTLLTTLLMRATPSEVRLILIDPKRIELSLYNGVPHLYVPVVTEIKEAASALAWAVDEMARRLKLLQKSGARNTLQYNVLVSQGKAGEGAEPLPYLVIVIDELADLMMVAAREVEDSIVRIAQLARAAGIHLVVATQRPEANVVTGLIKANITNRIAFNVATAIDSRVILDTSGAERLIGMGDMLFSTPQWPKPKRIQGAFVSEDETVRIVEHLKGQGEPDYHEEILHLKVAAAGGGVDTGEDDDPLVWEAADVVVTTGMGSTSMIQRRFKVGYARAGRIMDMLEAKGIVGPPDGSKPREVLVDVEGLEAIRAFERQDALKGGDA
ncbi:MAG: DNA translocase FtsK, partial [Actinobacteria bacterium]